MISYVLFTDTIGLEMHGILSRKSLVNLFKVVCFILLCKLYNAFVAASDDDKLTDMQIAKASILGVAAFGAIDAIAAGVMRGKSPMRMTVVDVPPTIPKLTHI